MQDPNIDISQKKEDKDEEERKSKEKKIIHTNTVKNSKSKI